MKAIPGCMFVALALLLAPVASPGAEVAAVHLAGVAEEGASAGPPQPPGVATPSEPPEAEPPPKSQNGNGHAGEGANDGSGESPGGTGVHPETLLLDVEVNGAPLPGIVSAERLADGRLVLPTAAWKAARLRPAGELVSTAEGERGYALDAVPGLTYRVDRSRLKLAISAAPEAFEGTRVPIPGESLVSPNPAPPGAYLNYDVTATRGEAKKQYGALLEGVIFSRWGSLVSGAAARGDERTDHVVRTETYWRMDLPGRMETLVAGDTLSNQGVWSRPARFGGLRYARDFSLAPGFVTVPLPAISGSAALPSTVDVLVNEQRRSSMKVPPGPFDLTNVPVVNGSGEINLVVRDLRGVETIITQSYYLSPRLFRPGLSDFSLEAGALRRDFGIESFDYGAAFGAGSYRYGIARALTVGTRLEAQETRQAGGVDAAGLLGSFAVLHAAAAWSRTTPSDVSGEGDGPHWVIGIERVTRRTGASLQWDHFDSGFRQFAAVAGESRPRDRFQAGVGANLARRLSVGANYVGERTWQGDRFELAGGNVGFSFPAGIYLSAYGSRRIDEAADWTAGVNLLVPLGPRHVVTASTQRAADGGIKSFVQASQGVPQGPGWGWSVRASDVETQRAQASATVNTNYAQVVAEGNLGAGTNAARLDVNGSLGWLEGVPFATRRIDQGAFAVVTVGDLGGVQVFRSNQAVATTNGHGRALVTGLIPYLKNELTLNPDELPFDVQIGGVEQVVVPYARSGVVVKFPVHRSRNALVVLRLPDGSPIPAGARVTVVATGEEFVVARRGEAYLMNLELENRLEVRWPGGSCALTLKLDPAAGVEPRIGPLTCGGSR